MDKFDICQENCAGCSHQGYLCRQFKWLAVENVKSISQKVKFKVMEKSVSATQTIKHYSGQCPTCNAPVTTHYHINNCGSCGQKLDWE